MFYHINTCVTLREDTSCDKWMPVSWLVQELQRSVIRAMFNVTGRKPHWGLHVGYWGLCLHWFSHPDGRSDHTHVELEITGDIQIYSQYDLPGKETRYCMPADIPDLMHRVAFSAIWSNLRCTWAAGSTVCREIMFPSHCACSCFCRQMAWISLIELGDFWRPVTAIYTLVIPNKLWITCTNRHELLTRQCSPTNYPFFSFFLEGWLAFVLAVNRKRKRFILF